MAVLEFRTIEPNILYFGTPVALISSLNEDRTTNLAPMSSFWVLEWTHPQCVVNIPSPELWKNVERLAPLTGKNPVPETKAKQFRFAPDKFKSADLKPLASDLVRPARAREWPVQMDARIQGLHRIRGAKLEELGGGIAAEVEIMRLHVASDFVPGDKYIDPAKWSPLIYNFRHYFRLAERELGKTFRAERSEFDFEAFPK
jgi:flavin reductase (DIM6/NTAB) family NADH-FMN oxidoreductase RutF